MRSRIARPLPYQIRSRPKRIARIQFILLRIRGDGDASQHTSNAHRKKTCSYHVLGFSLLYYFDSVTQRKPIAGEGTSRGKPRRM